LENSELDQLRREFPLSREWAPVSIIQHVTQLGAIAIRLVGLSTVHASGPCVTGSAGDLQHSPLRRAYFELIERTSVVEAMTRTDSSFQVKTSLGEPSAITDRDLVFPAHDSQQRWRFSRSNGVAVASRWADACFRARLELIERDRVLHAWYGTTRPERIAMPIGLLPDLGTQGYEVQTYLFHSVRPSPHDVTVVGVFAFPERPATPLAFGFGARPSLPEAAAAAAIECLQRLGFLWDEALPETEPSFSPTPDYHQDYFLYPPHHARLRAWLAGAHCGRVCIPPPDATVQCAPPGFIDLTPHALQSKLAVAKTMPTGELALTFGRGHPQVGAELPEPLVVHPIA
jgi:hypothetical protein